MIRRTPLRRTPFRRTPTKPKPRRKPTPSLPRSVREAVIRRSGGRCEAALPGCTHRGTEIHHRQLRRPDNHTEDNCVHLCSGCHKVTIHGNVGWARRHGWLVSRWADPTEVTAVYGCDLSCDIDHV